MPKNVERFSDDIMLYFFDFYVALDAAAQAARVTEAHEISSGP